MRPIEEFVYVGNQVIVPDQASLMRCYYPIIGGEGYALYQYFMAFYDNGNHRHKFATILNHLNFGMQPLQESLAVLTAVDLLAFYNSPQGIYVVELKSPLSIEQFLKHAVYSSLLEQKIGEPAVDALKPKSLHGLQDLSKRFSDVFTDERLAQKSVSEIKPKNSFDLISFRNRMQADGLVFTDEKTDVPEIYKLSETYDMNWYDTYLLSKKTAVNHQIIVKRMKVQLEQDQAQKLGGDSALTETEKKILKAVKSGKPVDYLQSAKGPGGTVTNSEKKFSQTWHKEALWMRSLISWLPTVWDGHVQQMCIESISLNLPTILPLRRLLLLNKGFWLCVVVTTKNHSGQKMILRRKQMYLAGVILITIIKPVRPTKPS